MENFQDRRCPTPSGILGRVVGLTVKYRLRLRAQDTSTGVVEAEDLVRRARNYALHLRQSGRVDGVGPVRSDRQSLDTCHAWNRRMDPYERRWRVRPEQPVRGWVFDVNVGEACEPLRLGLCQYPFPGRGYLGRRQLARLKDPRNAVWRLEGFCKTHYASLHGWEHFRRCHLAVFALLEWWRRTGARLSLDDERAYWPGRSEDRLRRTIAVYDEQLAAVAGALKDATETAGQFVEAPTFSHPQFERLEAKGLAAYNGKVRQVAAAVKQLAR